MPSTTVGLLIFITLLLPGLIHVLVVERGKRPSKQDSPFREVAIIATSSIGSIAFALGLLAIARLALPPSRTPDVGRMVEDFDTYFTDNYAVVSLWAAGVLVTACLTSYLFAGTGLGRWIAETLPPKRETSVGSGWWAAFAEHPTMYKEVRCRLTTDVQVTGWLKSHSGLGVDTPDRDMLLSAPYSITEVDGSVRHEQYGAVVLNARDIAVLEIQHDPDGPELAYLSDQGEAEPQTA